MVAYTVTILHKLTSSHLVPVQHKSSSALMAAARYVCTYTATPTSLEPPDGSMPHRPLYPRRVYTIPAYNNEWRQHVCVSAFVA